MIQFIKNIFWPGLKVDVGALIAGGAIILDVRTPGEYASGHLPGSINIPLSTLTLQMGKLNKEHVIITVCASGMRSRSAQTILVAAGYTNVYNGGNWQALKKYEHVKNIQ